MIKVIIIQSYYYSILELTTLIGRGEMKIVKKIPYPFVKMFNFTSLKYTIENPQLCPLEAGENPGPPALIDNPDLRNSWGFPLKSGCSTGIGYFIGHCCSKTLIQAKSFDIKVNVAICFEQGGTDLQMHVHEWLQ